MTKGCITAAIVVILFAVVCIGGSFFAFFKYGDPYILSVTEFSIEEYKRQNPLERIPTTNEAWTEALIAEESSIKFKRELSQFAPAGQIVDLQQQPIKLVEQRDGSIVALSAGKDQEFDTEDDQTSHPRIKEYLAR